MKFDFRIIVFAHTRTDCLEHVLESLKRQDALKYTEVWLDGHQGNPDLKKKLSNTIACVEEFGPSRIVKHNGNLGFRKLILHAFAYCLENCSKVVFLEDDCFPTRDAVASFQDGLEAIKDNAKVFSVYGHPFLNEGEFGGVTRFQGWGWGTTAGKLAAGPPELTKCYLMKESDYLGYVDRCLSEDVKARLSVTPGRDPLVTLSKFFAWDETMALLTAKAGMIHTPTDHRVIYNFGTGPSSTHFRHLEALRDPPLNMVGIEEIWDKY